MVKFFYGTLIAFLFGSSQVFGAICLDSLNRNRCLNPCLFTTATGTLVNPLASFPNTGACAAGAAASAAILSASFWDSTLGTDLSSYPLVCAAYYRGQNETQYILGTQIANGPATFDTLSCQNAMSGTFAQPHCGQALGQRTLPINAMLTLIPPNKVLPTVPVLLGNEMVIPALSCPTTARSLPPPPPGGPASITGFTPQSGTLGTVVKITGSGFTNANAVTIGTVPAVFTVVNDTTITATMGALTKTDFITVSVPATATALASIGTTKGTLLGAFGDGRFESLCQPGIDIHRSLAISDLSVLSHSNTKGINGNWSFNFLMSQMAPAGMTPSTFIKKWLINWRDTKNVNGNALVPPPPAVPQPNTSSISALLTAWPRIIGGPLEFDNTPPLDLNSDQFILVAITFRPDLDKTSATPSAGEGRFIFRIASTKDDEVILEYKLPISMGTLPMTADNWNLGIHDLSSQPFGSAYISQLQFLTDRFTKKTFTGVAGMQNGSGINQVRTNTIASEGSQWALREFRLATTAKIATSGVIAAAVGELASTTTNNNPAETFNTIGSTVEAWAKLNSAALLAGTAVFDPATLGGFAPSQNTNGWNFSPTVINPSVKKAFDMSTCKGCHSPTVNLNNNFGVSNPFLQASKSGFSSFMTGTSLGKVAAPIVFTTTPMPGPLPTGFNAPFTFNATTGVATPNVGYSDLHARAHNLLNKTVTAFCR